MNTYRARGVGHNVDVKSSEDADVVVFDGQGVAEPQASTQDLADAMANVWWDVMHAFPEGQIIVHVPEFQNNNLEVQQDEALGAAWRVKCVRDERHNVQDIKKMRTIRVKAEPMPLPIGKPSICRMTKVPRQYQPDTK